jgi:putative thioredoxin
MSNINLAGALDLSSLTAKREESPKPNNAFVIEVTADSFEEQVLKASLAVPVVVDLWATWCEPCKSLSPILERLAAEYAGAFVLAKIDVDAQQEIAAAFQVQSIPTVYAILKGQVMPLFQGAVAYPQAKQAIELVLAEAAKYGITPAANPDEAIQEPPSDPRFEAAEAAIESGDWALAVTAYESLLAQSPADPIARIGLLNAQLFARVGDGDLAQLSQVRSTQFEELLLTLDALFLLGEYGQCFELAIEIVATTQGDDRARVRSRLLEYFEILGGQDPLVAKARISLANALF